MKPQQARVEVDLAVNTNDKTYDRNARADILINKQVTPSQKLHPFSNDCEVAASAANEVC